MPRFSVVIPVYNTDPYLDECIDSLRQQTCGDWEAVCVDDGSSDCSGQKLDNIAAKDNRIHVLHQPHLGVSAARNTGLDNVHGDYILFLDSDDMLTSDALETLDSIIDGEDFIRFGSDRCDFVSVTIRCYRRDFLQKHQLRFHEGIVHEDNLFTSQVCYYAQRTKEIDNSFYIYRIREGSIMTSKGLRNYQDLLTVANLLTEFFTPKKDIDRSKVYRFITHHYQVAFYHSNSQEDKELLPYLNWDYYHRVSRTRLRHRINYAAMRISPSLFRITNRLLSFTK